MGKQSRIYKFDREEEKLLFHIENMGLYRTRYDVAEVETNRDDLMLVEAPSRLALPRAEYMLLEDAARAIGTSARTLRRLLGRKEIRGRKVRGRWLVGRGALNAYVLRQARSRGSLRKR